MQMAFYTWTSNPPTFWQISRAVSKLQTSVWHSGGTSLTMQLWSVTSWRTGTGWYLVWYIPLSFCKIQRSEVLKCYMLLLASRIKLSDLQANCCLYFVGHQSFCLEQRGTDQKLTCGVWAVSLLNCWLAGPFFPGRTKQSNYCRSARSLAVQQKPICPAFKSFQGESGPAMWF